MNAVEWNRKHAVGTLVKFTMKGAPLITRTVAPAWSLSTGRGVVPLQGVKGSVLIESLQVMGLDPAAARTP